MVFWFVEILIYIWRVLYSDYWKIVMVFLGNIVIVLLNLEDLKKNGMSLFILVFVMIVNDVK